MYIYIYIYIYIYGNRISEGLHPRSLVVGGPGGHYFDFKGHLIDIIEILVFSSLSNLSDLTKMAIFHRFEPPGYRKSDSLTKNDSFWWGERLRTSKIRLFHILVYICPLPVTISVYLSIACHYRRIFVQGLSLSAYGLHRRARLGGPKL